MFCGSLTVEASLVLPLFVFAILSILYVNKLLLFEEKVQWAMTRVGREALVEQAVTEKNEVVNVLYLTGKMNLYIPKECPRVSLARSTYDKDTGDICVIADYCANIPFPLISRKVFHFTEEMRTRSFCGVKTRAVEEQEDDRIVYVTRTGQVYHRDLNCTYLKLSISQVKRSDIDNLRSESGAKYYPCESCISGELRPNNDVFICNYGNRYHTSRSCRRIKRSIQEIALSQVGGRLPCSKCGMEE